MANPNQQKLPPDSERPNQHSALPPVSYEALAENNRHTHANLNFCIAERQRLEAENARLEEQLEVLREAVADALPGPYVSDEGPAVVSMDKVMRVYEALDSNPASSPPIIPGPMPPGKEPEEETE